ncbi:hypothetical protein MJO29_015470 [Puccinia striiformis f. sp. tritici]|uniref:hypothetical protein n=1 Tax=Puccinia striiformis f. sp. tritici TaxID=168172 RepID=UPI002008489F|nr:hypothetical protein Pst134EA_029043 [Puccinia striiformis f. sp. tritici]KAH9441097.1 hypothetical protein Pst134EB_029746 [Puccinia striiformis f. sp. tritici]KAH9447058.1 hypothetical protein Pst134EA_029043 [Puccinia striiformis f. sp. tritici]KAI7936167.1 hypothetical protein MJO29_015470 [Puccinia striiformis f. sp. tritici]KAI9617214.1 hypothetical protein H4Q26_013079 [Puccinia striiformis f. sp. tritici PST-130]
MNRSPSLPGRQRISSPSASDSSIDLSIYLADNRIILIRLTTNALKNPSALDFLVALFSTSSSFDPFLIMF